jgi:predicted O-methyltransferase YrrM
LSLIKGKLRNGGLLIIDNMLWHGQVFDPKDHQKSTEAIREFTRVVTSDPDWIVSLAPIRDGMIVAFKK